MAVNRFSQFSGLSTQHGFMILFLEPGGFQMFVNSTGLTLELHLGELCTLPVLTSFWTIIAFNAICASGGAKSHPARAVTAVRGRTWTASFSPLYTAGSPP